MLDVLRRIIEHVVANIAEAELMHSAVIKYNHYYGGIVITLSVSEAKNIVLEWLEI